MYKKIDNTTLLMKEELKENSHGARCTETGVANRGT